MSNYILPFFALITVVAVIAIYAMALQWITKLEETNCKCSEDFKRDYMKYYLYIYFGNLAFIFVSMILTMIYMYLASKKSGMALMGFMKVIYRVIQVVIPILSLVNMVFSIMYIYNLKQIDCKCSEDTKREVYYIWNIISAAVVGMNILFIILASVGLFFISKK